MQISTFTFYTLIEAFVFLLFICLILVIYAKRNKTKIVYLQKTVKKLLTSHKQLKKQLLKSKEEETSKKTYKKHIDEQLEETKRHHTALEPGQDIALDLHPDAPSARQTAAFRHAVLVAEKEAFIHSKNEQPNWEILENKVTQLMNLYTDLSQVHSDSSGQDLDTTQDQASTQDPLDEELKALYCDIKKSWDATKAKSEQDYLRLKKYGEKAPKGGQLKFIVQNLANTQKEFDTLLQSLEVQIMNSKSQVTKPSSPKAVSVNSGKIF